jgi:hypothetical protein
MPHACLQKKRFRDFLPVHNIARMEEDHSFDDVGKHAQFLGEVELLAWSSGDDFVQRFFTQFHHNINLVFRRIYGNTELVYNVWMVKGCERRGFPEKMFHCNLVRLNHQFKKLFNGDLRTGYLEAALINLMRQRKTKHERK